MEERILKIKKMLESATTVAIVGLSDNSVRDSYNVAKYLQSVGYKIIPVNPMLSEVLGEQCYPKLTDIEVPVDIVNIFRRSEYVHNIVNDAITIEAKHIWMQDGVVDENAALSAEKLGITVVMDDCILRRHKSLKTY
jgi:predicted CoA-binding protein